MGYNVAVDGPAGAGKSSAARAAAKKLGFIYVDTGALYRTVGLYMLRQGISLEETACHRQGCESCGKIDCAYRRE